MESQLLLALLGFAFVSSITPGPNNMMLLASGANFGFRRTLPHMAGVSLGFVFMAAALGLGLIGVFDAFPATYTVLKVVALVYMLWLAWKIANAAPPAEARAGGTPITFVQAAAFQWVNPKAWAMALTAITAYAPDRSIASVLVVAAAFGAVNLPSVSCWALLGQGMRRYLGTGRRLRIFNVTMALLLLASLWPVLSHSPQ